MATGCCLVEQAGAYEPVSGLLGLRLPGANLNCPMLMIVQYILGDSSFRSDMFLLGDR
jgi:hypothetical protein